MTETLDAYKQKQHHRHSLPQRLRLRRDLSFPAASDVDSFEQSNGAVDELVRANDLTLADLFELSCFASRFHLPRLIALCAQSLGTLLSLETIMPAIVLCVKSGIIAQDESVDSIHHLLNQSVLPSVPLTPSTQPQPVQSLPFHRPHDLSILLRLCFDFLSHHFDKVFETPGNMQILHSLPFHAFSAVISCKSKYHTNTTLNNPSASSSASAASLSNKYVLPQVQLPAGRLIRDLKLLYSQRNDSTSASMRLLTGMYPADFIIVVGDVKIKAHRCVLGARSEYFAALFRHEYTESSTNTMQLNSKQHTAESVETLLRYIYYHDLNDLSYESALFLSHHCTHYFGSAQRRAGRRV